MVEKESVHEHVAEHGKPGRRTLAQSGGSPSRAKRQIDAVIADAIAPPAPKATPGLNAKLRTAMVPGAGGKTPPSGS